MKQTIHIFDEVDGKYIFLYNEEEDKYYVKIIGQDREIELKVIKAKKRNKYFIRFIFPSDLRKNSFSSFSKDINLIKEKVYGELKNFSKESGNENIVLFDKVDDTFYFKYNIKEDKYYVSYKELDKIIELKVRYNPKRDFHQIRYYISNKKTYSKTINEIKNKIFGVYKIGENSTKLSEVETDISLYNFDEIDNRFLFQYNKDDDGYYVFDKKFKIKTKLEVRYSSKRDLEFIRYYYPKPNNIKGVYYHKSIYVIQFHLFGKFEKGSGSQLTLTDDICKKIIKKSCDELGFLLGYTDMGHSKDPLLRKVYSYISNNGGVSKYIEWTSELGINTTLYFKDHNDFFLKSKFEFIFFSILHYNQIEYKYEPFKVGTYVPDFYIPKSNYLIEILGLYGRDYYFKRTIDKEKLYISKGFNYKPIIVDRHHPNESIFKGCEEIFGKLKLPDFNEYSRKYILKTKEFIEQLKVYLKDVNEGRLKVSVRKDKNGFREKYPYYYKYVLENYGTIQMGIKEFIGIPSTKFKSQKIEQYWKNIDYVKDELETVFKNEKRIPTRRESLIKFRKKYNIWNVYRFWGEKSLLKGGKFFEFIEELKLKYGFIDIDLVNKIEKEKEQIEFLNQIHSVVILVYNGKLSINGKNSLFTKYRPIYSHLFKNFGGVFYYIKEKIGYPPPYILRPKGYYKLDENVKYELEENWKKYKRILGDTERLVNKNDNTYYNMVHILGIKEFREGGRYYKFIETLKKKYGYDDTIEKTEQELNENLVIYLKGINNGEWNTKTKSSKRLGLHGKYLSQVHKKYGNVFIGIKELIGFPNPRVIRYHKYYDSIDNCKYEIIENIKRLGYLPKRNDLRRPPLLGNNSISGVYQKYGVREFQKGGIFYKVIMESLRLYGN